MAYKTVHTIRYMGNKAKLLDFIIPEIEKITNPGDIVCDLMSGTCSVGYALKSRNIIYANDIQYYSYIISKFLLSDIEPISVEVAHVELDKLYNDNLATKKYSFFIDNYTDTYFSGEQCLEIDSLRYAIENADKKYFEFYLICLMNAMCKAQSTPGHFAQYMNKENKRIVALRQLSVYKLFYEKIKDFSSFDLSNLGNKCFNEDCVSFLENEDLSNVKCIYIDSPYTNDQYSRFYHILETVCKYDHPTLNFKAKYRTDRVKSEFCYKGSVLKEFEKIISLISRKNIKIVISYSNHGVVPPEEILEIGRKYYANSTIKYLDYGHSSQGKGTISIKEVLIILS